MQLRGAPLLHQSITSPVHFIQLAGEDAGAPRMAGQLDEVWPASRFLAQRVNLIRCDSGFSEQILAIFNEAIVNSTALYDYKPRSLQSMGTWFENKKKGNFPVIGALGDGGEFLGFASYGTFRAWPAYKYSVEHSVYVAGLYRGKGIGKLLLQAIIDAARDQEYHVLIGAIDSQNSASIRLHRGLGFEHAGTVRQVGFKFGRWLDVDFYQLILETPKQPVAD